MTFFAPFVPFHSSSAAAAACAQHEKRGCVCVCAEAKVKTVIYIDLFPCLEKRTTQEIIAQKIVGCREEVWESSVLKVYVCRLCKHANTS